LSQTKEQHREYMKVHRKGSQSDGSQTKGSQCPETIILSDGQLWHPDPLYYKKIEPVEEKPGYPAILVALTDPVKREKLERITSQLEAHGVSESVRYGTEGPTFDRVGEIAACLNTTSHNAHTAKSGTRGAGYTVTTH